MYSVAWSSKCLIPMDIFLQICVKNYKKIIKIYINAIDCRFDSHSRKWNIYYFHFLVLVTRQSVALSFAIDYALSAKVGETTLPFPTFRFTRSVPFLIETKCLNIRSPGFLCLPCYAWNTEHTKNTLKIYL